MHSIESVFLVILWICSSTLMDESLKHKICSDTGMTIDSAIVPFEYKFVYMISQDLIYKMDIINANQLEINSVKKCENWSPDIKPKIDIIDTNRTDHSLTLMNCELTMQWTISYDDNKVLDSRLFPGCVYDFEHINDPGSGNHMYLKYHSPENKITIRYENDKHMTIKTFSVRYLSAEPNKIRLFDETKPEPFHNTRLFSQINGKRLKAAFIYNNNWYLFADRYYCRVGLNENTFEECKPFPINNLIKDCDEESSEDKENQNTDLSLILIVVFIIIAIAVITIAIIVLFLYREVTKEATSSAISSASSH